MNWKTSLLAAAILASATIPARAEAATGKRALTFDDLMACKRVGEPIPSPDGKWVVFEATEVNLDENKKHTHLWIVPSVGGESRRLNPGSNTEELHNDESRPRFSPDGARLIFTAKTGEVPQIWMANFDANAGALTGTPHPLTAISTGADGAIWSPDGRNIVFVSAVYPDAGDDAANKERDEALKNSKVKAQIFTRLFYRHWNAFTENKRSHLFVVRADADPSHPENVQADATLRDLTPGDHDMPPFSLGGQDMYAISPDGKELAYTSNVDEVEATSTNNEIFLVPLTGGEPKKVSISPGSDSTPIYSPDGKWLAWRSQARAGYESDKQSLLIYNRANGAIRNATEKLDRSVEDMAWEPHSAGVCLSPKIVAKRPSIMLWLIQVFIPKVCTYRDPMASMEEISSPDPSAISEDKLPAERHTHISSLAFAPADKPDAIPRMFFLRSSVSQPNEIACMEGGKHVYLDLYGKALTHLNDALLFQLDLPPLEPFTFKGAENTDVQGFLLKPPGFDPHKKYPLKFLIHGGPQGAWGDSWSYRWNPELFAATGNYVVVMINPHGSTGYGQAFTDGVNGDWGGKPYVDLMRGLEYVEQTYPFIDKDREAALGASYGGYMINWILGHPSHFKCLVSHDGLFNAVAAYGATEELWFNEWEYKGTPWTNPETYAKWSPHQFAKDFKTPTLVIHGQLDYRLDVSQGFELFTTLQRLGVPSKMLYFPDEGHWVLKPQNSRLWNKTVSDWVNQWTSK